MSDEGEKSEKMEENGLREFLAQDEFYGGENAIKTKENYGSGFGLMVLI